MGFQMNLSILELGTYGAGNRTWKAWVPVRDLRLYSGNAKTLQAGANATPMFSVADSLVCVLIYSKLLYLQRTQSFGKQNVAPYLLERDDNPAFAAFCEPLEKDDDHNMETWKKSGMKQVRPFIHLPGQSPEQVAAHNELFLSGQSLAELNNKKRDEKSAPYPWFSCPEIATMLQQTGDNKRAWVLAKKRKPIVAALSSTMLFFSALAPKKFRCLVTF